MEFRLVHLGQGHLGFRKALGVVAAEAPQPEHHHFQKIPQQHGDKVEDQHDQRLVFIGQQNAVAAALDALEGVVPHGTGGGTADVAAAGGGAVDVLVAEVVGPPGKIHVLVVGEEQLVKDADLVQDGLAVEGRPAAGAEHPAGLGVAAGLQAVPPLAGKTQDRHIVAGVVRQFRLVVPQHQTADRKDFRVGVGGFQQFRQPVRLGEGVVVEQHHILTFGDGNALVHRVGKPGVAGVLDEGVAVAAAVAAGNLQALVGGTVVDDDELKVLFGLGPDRFNGIPQPARAVQVGDDDRCFHGISLLGVSRRSRG